MDIDKSRTMVTPEMSKQNPNWWRDERYAIYDLSVNSVIAYPRHDEAINLSAAQKTYRVRGYAYSGGGRRVTRVEISVDRGRSMLTSLPTQSYAIDLELLMTNRLGAC